MMNTETKVEKILWFIVEKIVLLPIVILILSPLWFVPVGGILAIPIVLLIIVSLSVEIINLN